MAIRPHMWPYAPSGPKYGHTGPYGPTCGHLGQMGRLIQFVPPSRSTSPARGNLLTQIFPRARVRVRVFSRLAQQLTASVAAATTPRCGGSARASPRPQRLDHRAHQVGHELHQPAAVAVPRASASLPHRFLHAFHEPGVAVLAAVPRATAIRFAGSTPPFAGRSAAVAATHGCRFGGRSETSAVPFWRPF